MASMMSVIRLLNKTFPADSKKFFSNLVYQNFNRFFSLPFVVFFNYGYADLRSKKIPNLVLKPEDEKNRYYIQLYHQNLEAVDLKGKIVLEIGSGRGGGASYVVRYLQPAFYVAVDLSEKNIAFSRQHHKLTNLIFVQGDSQSLPLGDNSFDVVINVESSHHYRSMEKFLSEVKRVLRPGGTFCWTDIRFQKDMAALQRTFEQSGLRKVSSKEITPQVTYALDLLSAEKEKAIQEHVPKIIRATVEDFAAIKGSSVHSNLSTGVTSYLQMVWRKD